MVQQDINPDDYVDTVTETDGVCRPCVDGDDVAGDYEALSRRIAALQTEINRKQNEAAVKVESMRRAMFREQENLIRLSDEMNNQKRRNLSMKIVQDENICDCEDHQSDVQRYFM